MTPSIVEVASEEAVKKEVAYIKEEEVKKKSLKEVELSQEILNVLVQFNTQSNHLFIVI